MTKEITIRKSNQEDITMIATLEKNTKARAFRSQMKLVFLKAPFGKRNPTIQTIIKGIIDSAGRHQRADQVLEMPICSIDTDPAAKS